MNRQDQVGSFVDFIAQEAMKGQNPTLDKILHRLNSIEDKLTEILPNNKLRLVSQKEAQEIIGFKRDWVDRHIKSGYFPKPMIIGSEKRWYLKDIERWLEDLPKDN